MFVKLVREGLGRIIILGDYLTRTRKLQRSAEVQAAVGKEAETLSLYQFYACPFCVRTRRAMHRLNVPIETRDAKMGSPHRLELEEGGGRIKVPCLRIDNGAESTWMYESVDIIRYLEDRFGARI
ncbi:MAG: glutathione S-transferase N-terminal domain-containing protein [Acidiferrobacterales bacterium]